MNHAFRSESDMVWYFIGVYIRNGILHGSFHEYLIKYYLFAALAKCFVNTRREILYLPAPMLHWISFIYLFANLDVHIVLLNTTEYLHVLGTR